VGVAQAGTRASSRLKNFFTRLRRKLIATADNVRHGGDTGGVIETPYAHLGAHHTVSTDHTVIPHLLGPVIRAGDVFVDVGCGRGRLLNWALDDGRAAAVFGLELDKRVAAEVALRLEKEEKVTVVAGDALSSLPDQATLLYLWNPFDENVMRRFKETVIEKYGRIGSLGRLRIVYHHCRHADVWTDDPRCRTEAIDLPPEVPQKAILISFGPALH
jgi:SAM-dependent methyltransferase